MKRMGCRLVVSCIMILFALPDCSMSLSPSADMCCQYSLTKAGLPCPLKMILEGRLPQVCTRCSELDFGGSEHKELKIESRGLAATVSSSHGQHRRGGQAGGRRRPRSVFVADRRVSGDEGKDTAGHAQNDENDERAKRRKSAKRIEAAMYAASLNEALRPLVRADMSAKDPALQAIVLSQIPLECLAAKSLVSADGARSASTQSSLGAVCAWFNARMRISANHLVNETVAKCEQDILDVTRDMKEGFRCEKSAAIAFAAALRGQDVRCRLVKDLSKDLRMVEDKSPRESKTEGKAIGWWTEVWCCETKSWIPVDPNGLREVDSNHERATGVVDWNPHCTHVIAAENGLISDVTRRYVGLWEYVESCRPAGNSGIVDEILACASQRKAVQGDEALIAEQRQFSELGAQEELPRSVSALRRHPLFVLERLLGETEQLKQGAAPVATIVIDGRQEKVHSKDQVQRLRTRDEWKMLLRVVRRDEAPTRTIKPKESNGLKGVPMSRFARIQCQEANQLFGEWQTDALDVGKVGNDGKIPTNDHGYVELLTARHLPVGCAHIDHEAAALVARGQKIDFAPAMVGKISKNGFERPLFQGIIVLKEFEERIQQGCIRRDARIISPAGPSQAGSHEKILADFRRLILQVLGRLVAVRSDTDVPDSPAASDGIDGLEDVDSILKELESQLNTLKGESVQAAQDKAEQHALDRTDNKSELPERIRHVMYLVKELGSDQVRAPGAITALGLAVNRLHLVLRVP